MSAQEAFDTLKSFFETRQAAKLALGTIKEGVEIGVVIGDTVECALFRQGEQPRVEKRPALNPDVEFHIKPESVYVLNEKTKDDIGDIGVNILKEVLAGNISVRIPGRLLNVINGGYLEMLKQGGAPVMAYLGRHGLSNIAKIATSLKKMQTSKQASKK